MMVLAGAKLPQIKCESQLEFARLSLIFAQFASQKGISLEKQDIITPLSPIASFAFTIKFTKHCSN